MSFRKVVASLHLFAEHYKLSVDSDILNDMGLSKQALLHLLRGKFVINTLLLEVLHSVLRIMARSTSFPAFNFVTKKTGLTPQ